MTKLRIESNGTATGTNVFVDGAKLTNVVSVAFSIDLHDAARVTLVLYADEIAIDGTMKLKAERAIAFETIGSASPDDALKAESA